VNPGKCAITDDPFTSMLKANIMVIFAKEPARAPPKDTLGAVLKIPMLGEIEIAVGRTGPSDAVVAIVRSV
jgi:hypothetical protein